MNFKEVFSSSFPYFVAIVAMLVVTSIYFSSAWEGKYLSGDDVVKGRGAMSEKYQYRRFENKEIIWTNRIFSGMPYFLSAKYNGTEIYSTIYSFFPKYLNFPRDVNFLFWYMLGFFILIVSMRINIWLALVGAIIFGLCTYNLLIIEAGHFLKVRTIAMIPPTLGGILLCFRGKYLWGFLLIAFFTGMQIMMGHFQMTYYFLLGVLCFLIVELVYYIREKKFKDYLKKLIIIGLGGLLGLAPNFAKLASIYKYNKHSIRGKSELTIGRAGKVKTKNGLDKDFINSWSSGKTESMMLFIPNVKGGRTGLIKGNQALIKKVPAKYKGFIGNMDQYWGNQPFTGGPFYIGSVVFFFFYTGVIFNKRKI